MNKILKPVLILISCIFLSCVPVFAYWDNNIDYDNIKNPWTELGEDGEFDLADGDLEDKLGDWGIYEDLFPEEVEDDYNDNYLYTPKKANNSSNMATRIKNESGRTAPKKYSGRWEKVNEHSIWSKNINGTYKQDYEWKFYPNGSSQCLVLAWAVIDDKLYSFDRSGYMIHNSNGWFLSYSDNLYAMSDGAHCYYLDYQKNGYYVNK